MSKKLIKNEVPSCACGKVDLYEVWLQNEKVNKETLIAKKKDDKSIADVTNKVHQAKK